MLKVYQNKSASSNLKPNGKNKPSPVYNLPTCEALRSDLFHDCPSSCFECAAVGGVK